MSRKLAISLLFVLLGLATWDVLLDHNDAGRVAAASEESQVRAFDDGLPPPRP
jgi:hypothetical protein